MRLPDDLIAELDAEAQERGMSRTAVMESRLRGVDVLGAEEAYRGLMAHVRESVPPDVSKPVPPDPSEPVMTCPDCGSKPTSPKVLAEGKCFFCRRKLVAA